MSEPKTVGELIRERRLARGLSLGQLATAVGRTAATVRSWERGQHSPAPDVIERLAVALGIEQADIEAAMYSEPPSLTVVTDEEESDEATSEATSVSSEASIETADGEGDDDTAEIGPVESEPAAPAEAESEFIAASADELGVMPRIEVPARDELPPAEVSDDQGAPVGVELVEPEGVDATTAPIGGDGDEVRGVVEPPPPTEEVVDVILDEAPPHAELADGVEAPAPSEDEITVLIDGVDEALVDEPTAAIGPPIARSPAVEPGHVGVAVKAEVLQEPSLPPFLAPLRTIFDPSRKWLYWIRGSLTVVAMLVMLLVLAWAAGELFDGIGDVLDTIESTDELTSGLNT